MQKAPPHQPQAKSHADQPARQTMVVNLHTVPPLNPNTYKKLRDELKGRNITLRLE